MDIAGPHNLSHLHQADFFLIFSPDGIPVVNLYFVNLFVCQAAVSSKGLSNCQQGLSIFLRFEADCHSFLDISDTPIFSHFYFRTIGFNFIYLKKNNNKKLLVSLSPINLVYLSLY